MKTLLIGSSLLLASFSTLAAEPAPVIKDMIEEKTDDMEYGSITSLWPFPI